MRLVGYSSNGVVLTLNFEDTVSKEKLTLNVGADSFEDLLDAVALAMKSRKIVRELTPPRGANGTDQACDLADEVQRMVDRRHDRRQRPPGG